jgi:serine/threonine protein kinase
MIGTTLNRYQITASIGAGGMGEVFRARDTQLNRDVAIKILPKDFVADADRLRRFEQPAPNHDRSHERINPPTTMNSNRWAYARARLTVEMRSPPQAN